MPPDPDNPNYLIHRNTPCELCGNDEAWHAENKPEHPYEPEGTTRGRNAADPMETRRSRERATSTGVGPAAYRQRPFPTDPALRMLLVEKGVISAEDLDRTDRFLLSLMGAAAVISSPGPSRESSPEPSRDGPQGGDASALGTRLTQG